MQMKVVMNSGWVYPVDKGSKITVDGSWLRYTSEGFEANPLISDVHYIMNEQTEELDEIEKDREDLCEK